MHPQLHTSAAFQSSSDRDFWRCGAVRMISGAR
jgi:hypothetical protein